MQYLRESSRAVNTVPTQCIPDIPPPTSAPPPTTPPPPTVATTEIDLGDMINRPDPLGELPLLPLVPPVDQIVVAPEIVAPLPP